MKKLLLISTLLFCPVPAVAQQVTDYDVCTRNREVYVPGYYDRYGQYIQGYVRTETYSVPCGPVGYQRPYRSAPNVAHPPAGHASRTGVCDPSRTLLGMVAGGGTGAVLSRGEGRWWAVPLGAVVGGTIFGCN